MIHVLFSFTKYFLKGYRLDRGEYVWRNGYQNKKYNKRLQLKIPHYPDIKIIK
jgi:hypothetical protein